MEVTKERLLEQYGRLETPRLIKLFKTRSLTSLAAEALNGELARRGVSAQHLREAERAERVRQAYSEYYEGLPKASRRIDTSVGGLYVIAALQCLGSLIFQFRIGVYVGLALAALTTVILLWKSPTAGAIVAIFGGVESIINFFGPMIVGGQFGNLLLSGVTVWLGIRCHNAACLWQDVTPIPSQALQLQYTHNRLAGSPDPEGAARQPASEVQRLDWLEKATAFQKSYNYGDAIEAYSKAIEVDPNHAAAYFNRAFLYTKLRKLDSALRDLRAAARLGHGKSQALLRSRGIPW